MIPPQQISLISTEDLAASMGYSGATTSFREWCTSMRIQPVPGRRGYFDPALVRRRLDEAQGLSEVADIADTDGLVSARRLRRASR